jgi:uncharacterized protein YbcV (DUF1398 family)
VGKKLSEYLQRKKRGRLNHTIINGLTGRNQVVLQDERHVVLQDERQVDLQDERHVVLQDERQVV